MTQSAFCVVALCCLFDPPIKNPECLCVRVRERECVRVCVCVCGQLFIGQYKNEKCVYLHNCMREQCEIPSSCVSGKHLFAHTCMDLYVSAHIHVQAATSFTLGSLNVGHKALKTLLRHVWTTPPQPPLHFTGCLTVCC